MRKTTWFVIPLALMAIGMLSNDSATATTIFSDDFESYADTTAMNAVWSNGGSATLDGGLGNPGQSLAHPGTSGSFSGGNTNSVSFAGLTPSATQPIIYTADIYDDGTSANKRVTAGLRAAAAANLFEMGMYNSPNHYAYRAVLPGPSWGAFTNITDDGGASIENEPIQGWHRYQLVLDGATATFTLDLGSTGIINATEVVNVAFNAANPVDIIRLGGPSDLGSGGGGANFDNISLVQIPEPTTLVLASLAGICVLGRRK